MPYVSVTWLLIGIFSLASNSFVACIILSCQKLRNCANAILCSMLLSSCAITIFYVLPGRVFVHWRENFIFLCSIIPSIVYASITCYILHICVNCLDKVVSILAPFGHRNLLTIKNVTIVIICLWTTPYLLCAIPFLTYRPYSSQYCIYHNYTQIDYIRDRIFHTVFFTFEIFIPIISTTILYIAAFIKVNSKKRRRIRNAFMISMISQGRQNSNMDKNWKIALQMMLMLGLFMICWLPLLVSFIVVRYSLTAMLRTLLNIFQYIAFIYHIINPIFIASFQMGIRRQIKRVLVTIYARIRRKSMLILIPKKNNQLRAK